MHNSLGQVLSFTIGHLTAQKQIANFFLHYSMRYGKLINLVSLNCCDVVVCTAVFACRIHVQKSLVMSLN